MTSIATILNSESEHTKILSLAGSLGDELNINTYIVGGYVRDLLLNRKTNDIDIMVEGDAIEFANSLASKLNVKTVVEFPEFQTALIPYSDIEIEIASARKESYREKSRKPIVQKCTIDEDLSRRDFTVNAMAASLMKNNYGELNDPHGGIGDLQRKILITPLEPEATFKDDPLRILRGVRFASQLNFSLASNVKDAMISQRKHLEFISQERITQEVIKTLKTPKPSIGLNLLRELNLYPYVFPEVDNLMADIFDEVSEDLRKDQYKQIWLKYKKIIISFISIFILSVIAFKSIEYYQEKKKIAAASIDMDNSIKDNLGKVKEHLHENEEQLQSIKDNQTIGSSFDSTRENQKKEEQAIKKEIDQERKDDENNASSST